MGQRTVFDSQRDILARQSSKRREEGQSAVDRKLASMGNLNSGAALKIKQKVDAAEADNLNTGMAQVNAAEQQQSFASQEAQKQRDFAATEAEKSRGAQESQFTRGLALQKAGLDEQTAARLDSLKLSREQMAIQDRQFGDSLSWQKTLGSNQMWQQGEQLKLLERQFEEDKKTTLFNKYIEGKESGVYIDPKTGEIMDQVAAQTAEADRVKIEQMRKEIERYEAEKRRPKINTNGNRGPR